MKKEDSERIEELKKAHIEELHKLQVKFYREFDELQLAVPDLSPETYELMEQNIRDQYWLEYQHYDEEYRTELEREIIRMRTRREILVPFHWWKGWWIFKRYRQNRAQDLIDREVAEDAEEFFARIEAENMAKRFKAAQAALSGKKKGIAAEDKKGAEGAQESAEDEYKQAAETAADKLMKEYRNKTKKKNTEKGAGNGNAGTGECT